MENSFQNALGNFIRDFASGGAIRHYTDLGYTVDEIAGKLDFPASKESIAKTVFQYYLDNGMVLLTEPKDFIEKAHFVKDRNAYGKTSMRKVVEKIPSDPNDYEKCSYGKQLYQSGEITASHNFSQKMLDHICALPWPLQEVWVKKDLFG